MPTRRRWLQLTGVGLSVGLAGCGETPNPSGVGESSGNVENSQPSSTQDSGDAESGSEPEESSVDDYVPEGGRLITETNEILSEIEWFATEYDSAIYQYRNTHFEAIREIEDLLEVLDDGRPISSHDLDRVSDSLNRGIAVSEDVLEPHFTDHFYFGYIENEYISEAQSYRRRSDWPVVRENLEDAREMYRGALTGKATSERYSTDPIYNRLYEFIRGSDVNDRFFELRLEGPMRNPYKAYVTQGNAEIMYDPIDGRVEESLTELYAPFNAPIDRTHSLLMNAYNEGVLGPDRTDRIDPRELEPMSLYVQKYKEIDHAQTAYDLIMEDKTVESTGTLRPQGEEWDQVYYHKDESTIYLYAKLVGDFIFVLGQSRDAWDKRSDDWNAHFDGTWLDRKSVV